MQGRALETMSNTYDSLYFVLISTRTPERSKSAWLPSVRPSIRLDFKLIMTTTNAQLCVVIYTIRSRTFRSWKLLFIAFDIYKYTHVPYYAAATDRCVRANMKKKKNRKKALPDHSVHDAARRIGNAKKRGVPIFIVHRGVLPHGGEKKTIFSRHYIAYGTTSAVLYHRD